MVKRWVDSNPDDILQRDQAYLVRGSRLVEAERWFSDRHTELNTDAQSFIQASIEERDIATIRELTYLPRDIGSRVKLPERRDDLTAHDILAVLLALGAITQNESDLVESALGLAPKFGRRIEAPLSEGREVLDKATSVVAEIEKRLPLLQAETRLSQMVLAELQRRGAKTEVRLSTVMDSVFPDIVWGGEERIAGEFVILPLPDRLRAAAGRLLEDVKQGYADVEYIVTEDLGRLPTLDGGVKAVAAEELIAQMFGPQEQPTRC